MIRRYRSALASIKRRMINAGRPAAILIARFTARRRHADAPLASSLPARGDPLPPPSHPPDHDLDLERRRGRQPFSTDNGSIMRIESVSIIDASRPRRQGAEGGGGQVRDGAVAAYRIGRIASRDRSIPAQGIFRALRSARSLTVDLPLPSPPSVLLISYWRSAAGRPREDRQSSPARLLSFSFLWRLFARDGEPGIARGCHCIAIYSRG